MYLFFDTETSGFPTNGLGTNSPLYARVLQLACLLTDENFKEIAAYKTLIKLPTHTSIDPGAQKAHGISKELCYKYGVAAQHALAVFQDFLDKSEVQVAHNIAFDTKMLGQEFQAEFKFNDFVLKKPFCTMNAMTDICKIPSPKIPNKFKWPKLIEAYQHCYGKAFDGAHDAMSDVKACAAIFKWLKEHNAIQNKA